MHPILAAVAAVDEALKTVADTNPTFMATEEKCSALRELAVVEAKVAELRLRVLADTEDVAALTGSRDVAGWVTSQTRVRFEDARADLALARSLDRRWSVLGAAMREGQVTLAQARVVAQALDGLPADTRADVVAAAEETLVGYAGRFEPRQLARLGRRILDVVAPEVAEEAEARRLSALEAEGARRTRLTLRRFGDGTTLISARVPDAVADRALVYLGAYANPRRAHEGCGDDPCDRDGCGEMSMSDGTIGETDPEARLPYPRRLGEAFCQLLESLDPTRLPLHGGDATTLVVTIGFETLTRELGTAGLLSTSHVPGEEGTGAQITAAHARRLACTATILPAVLGGESEVLDLGRARRLYNTGQRRALLIRDRTCRAEGCDIPGTWAEAHHWIPWLLGGPTDLTNGVLLCSHHHHRAHDPGYTTERLPNGDVRFTRRT